MEWGKNGLKMVIITLVILKITFLREEVFLKISINKIGCMEYLKRGTCHNSYNIVTKDRQVGAKSSFNYYMKEKVPGSIKKLRVRAHKFIWNKYVGLWIVKPVLRLKVYMNVNKTSWEKFNKISFVITNNPTFLNKVETLFNTTKFQQMKCLKTIMRSI